MAVRILTYTVDEDAVATSSIAQGGVQGEHNATQIDFIISNSLITRLEQMLENNEKKEFCYRFDMYDSAGGKKSTEPNVFIPTDKTKFTCLIEEWQTRYGGTIQVFFVITLSNDVNMEMELYSYNVKLMLKSKPSAKETDNDNYESMSTLAMVAKNKAAIALEAAAQAVDACERTENARLLLENGVEWVFDGGDSKSTVDIEFVVDDIMSDTSRNPVSNRVVKKYIDTKNKELNNKILPAADYICEEGEIDGWTYEKRESGIAVCWRNVVFAIDRLIASDAYHFYFPIGDYVFPIVNGESLFLNEYPHISCDVSNAANELLAIGQGGFHTFRGLQSRTQTGLIYAARTSLYTDGFIKTTDSSGRTVYMFPNGNTLRAVLSIEAKGRWK